jgi:hypothetical protein
MATLELVVASLDRSATSMETRPNSMHQPSRIAKFGARGDLGLEGLED